MIFPPEVQQRLYILDLRLIYNVQHRPKLFKNILYYFTVLIVATMVMNLHCKHCDLKYLHCSCTTAGKYKHN